MVFPTFEFESPGLPDKRFLKAQKRTCNEATKANSKSKGQILLYLFLTAWGGID